MASTFGNAHKKVAAPSHKELGLKLFESRRKPSRKSHSKRSIEYKCGAVADFVAEQFYPCRAAEIGGRSSLLSEYLTERSFHMTIISADLAPCELRGEGFLASDSESRQMTASKAGDSQVSLPRLHRKFTSDMGSAFDLLIGLYAHGQNLAIVEAVAEYGCEALLIPCCANDEPFTPPKGKDWFEWLIAYIEELELSTELFALDMTGQNIGIMVWKEKPKVSLFS